MYKRVTASLLLLLLLSFGLNFFSLTRGHLWWDDFAGYLMQAKSILTWSMDDFLIHNTFTVQNSSITPGPAAYPWGFPLLLAPFYALFGMNPLALKLINLIFFAGFQLGVFFLARTRLRTIDALILTGVFSFAPVMVAANDLIQSDIPFLTISTFSLILVESHPLNKKWLDFAIGFSIFYAFFLRTNGVLLIVPLLITLLLRYWPDWVLFLKKSAIPFFSFMGLYILQMLFFPGGQSSYLSHFSLFSLPHLWENFLYYLWLPAWFFNGIPGGFVFYPIILILLIFSLRKHWRRDAGLYIYTILTFLIFIVWPERQGLRFIYPVLPILFILSFDGMFEASNQLDLKWRMPILYVYRVCFCVILLAGLGLSSYASIQNMSAGRAINGPFDSYSQEMYAFIRKNTLPDKVMIFMRPRALRLFTDRDAFLTENCADLIKGDYVILHQKMEDNGQIPPGQILSCKPTLQMREVYRNKRFLVYQINH